MKIFLWMVYFIEWVRNKNTLQESGVDFLPIVLTYSFYYFTFITHFIKPR